MNYIRLGMLLGIAVVYLSGCGTIMPIYHSKSTDEPVDAAATPQGTPEVQTTPQLTPVTDSSIGSTSIGGAVEVSMDAADKTKMMRAMDKAPGKSTEWVNARTQIKYTVTPTKKVHAEDNSFCRQYQVSAVDSNDKERTIQGVACVASDGNWHVLQD